MVLMCEGSNTMSIILLLWHHTVLYYTSMNTCTATFCFMERDVSLYLCRILAGMWARYGEWYYHSYQNECTIRYLVASICHNQLYSFCGDIHYHESCFLHWPPDVTWVAILSEIYPRNVYTAYIVVIYHTFPVDSSPYVVTTTQGRLIPLM